MNRPSPPSDSRHLWEGFERHELQLPTCRACGNPHLPPGPVCPYCFSFELEWQPASGRATLSTWVVERKKWFDAFEPPYIVAEVELEEGPRTPAHIAVRHLNHLKLGAPGVVGFYRAGNGLTLPRFEPDDLPQD